VRPGPTAPPEVKLLFTGFLPKAIATILALLIALVWVGPFLLMVVTSIKPNAEFLRGPLYTTLRTLHLLDTKIGLILVHGVYGMPMQILALRGFMTSIPKEIDKAAFIEGATDFQVFWKIILPLSIPGILVSYTLNFIAIWKEFVFSLVFLNNESNFPVTVGMLKLNSDRYMSAFNLPSAGLVISQIPIIILFLLLYRKMAGGKVAGAVKG
jgi:raffinose/stachyose/melibiose transport system permease protein